MIAFAVRNLRIFFRDRAAVFFSLLAVFIIIGLYALFLSDVWTAELEGFTGVRYMMDSWIMAGLLAVTSVTTTMGAFGVMVEDRSKKIYKDFSVTPVRRGSLAGGYVISAVTIGIIMSVITLILAELYIVSGGGELLDAGAMLKTLGMIVFSTIANTSMVLFIVSFFKSANAYATACTVIGTLIGFLTGIYMPVGNLPEGVQWVVKCFPPSHSALLFRRIMMEAPVSQSFSGAPEEVADGFMHQMGVVFDFGGTDASPWVSVAVLAVSAAVFYALSVYVMSRKKDR